MILKTVQAIQNLVKALSGEEPIPVKTNVEALKQLYEVRGGQDDVSKISLIPDIIQKIAENEGLDGAKWIPVRISYPEQVEGCSFGFFGYVYNDKFHTRYLTSGTVPAAGITVYVQEFQGRGILPLFPIVADGYEQLYEATNAEEVRENSFVVEDGAEITCVIQPG